MASRVVRACVTPDRRGDEGPQPERLADRCAATCLSLTDRFDRFFPVGFYYKTFIRPRRLWPLYEAMLRRIAGLGRVDITARPDLHPAQAPPPRRRRRRRRRAGGLSGGPRSGARGCSGHPRRRRDRTRRAPAPDRTAAVRGDRAIAGLTGVAAAARLRDLVARGARRIEYLGGATAIGDVRRRPRRDHPGSTFVRVRAGRIVLATGAAERPMLFDANDRPGIMLGIGCRFDSRDSSRGPGRPPCDRRDR